MSSTRHWSASSMRAYLAATFLLFAISCEALQISYCSPNNFASSNEVTYTFMSNGYCQDNCKASYVFAVIQDKYCWCTNYVPADTVSTSECDVQCPGYPDDLCGNAAQGLYGYYNLGGIPSGTQSGSAAPTSGPSSSSQGPIQSPSSSQSSSSDSETETLSSTQSSSAPTVITSVISVTGKASTILVTPSATSTDSSLGQSTQPAKNNSGGGLGGGAVAGIVIGVAIIIGLIIGCGVFFWLRKKHRRNLEAVSEGGSVITSSHGPRSQGGVPSRQVSQMSSAGLLSRPARANTGAISESNGGGTLSSDRNSTHMTVDQRLNPWAIYSNEISRASNVSLQDNQDYSRQLRVANPDP